jgi:hypothetical protein
MNLSILVGAAVISALVIASVTVTYFILKHATSLDPEAESHHAVRGRFDSLEELHAFNDAHDHMIANLANKALANYRKVFSAMSKRADPTRAALFPTPAADYKQLK